MSSLTVHAAPWRALPGPETTIEELSQALKAFPELDIEIGEDFSITIVTLGAPPDTKALTLALFGTAADYLIEDSGVFELPDFEDLIDQEAQDRNAEGV